MTRERLSARSLAAARRGDPDFILCEIDTPNGTERYWSGLGPITWQGHPYIGTGGLASVSGLSSDATAFIQTITLSLALDATTANYTALDLKGYEARLYHGFLDAHYQIIPDPVLIAAIVLDVSTEKHEAGQVSIQLSGQTGFVTLEQPARLLWTQEQLAHDHPGVTGFDRMPGDAAKQISWGP